VAELGASYPYRAGYRLVLRLEEDSEATFAA
jgi:hypothetical protein